MDDFPPVSCLCLTYARPPHLVEEAVYSFLMQDYPGEKELLILNDFDRQVIRFDHPEVTVVNVPARFHSLGEKRNAAAALCRHDLHAVWDDDDIHLPHRLSVSVRRYDPQRRFFKGRQIMFLNNGAITGHTYLSGHGTMLWHRGLFDAVGGYKHIDSGEDQEIEGRFNAANAGRGRDEPLPLAEIFYLYRWAGTDSYHVSAYATEAATHATIEQWARHQIAAGHLPGGEIALHPHWRADYPALARRYLVTPLVRTPWVGSEPLPDGQIALFNASTAQRMTLNPTAAFVWACCDGAHSPAMIVDELRAIFPGADWIDAHVLALLNELTATGMLAAPDHPAHPAEPAALVSR